MRDTLGFQKLILMIVVASPEVGSFHNLVILNERERANEQRRERERERERERCSVVPDRTSCLGHPS